MRSCFCVSSILFIFASSTFAASFDCGKKLSKVEELICQAPSINEVDGQMGAVFNDLIKRSSSPERKRIRAAQQKWIHHRDVECLQTVARPLECLERMTFD